MMKPRCATSEPEVQSTTVTRRQDLILCTVHQTPADASCTVARAEDIPASEGKHRRPKTNDANALVHTAQLGRLNAKPRG